MFKFNYYTWAEHGKQSRYHIPCHCFMFWFRVFYNQTFLYHIVYSIYSIAICFDLTSRPSLSTVPPCWTSAPPPILFLSKFLDIITLFTLWRKKTMQSSFKMYKTCDNSSHGGDCEQILAKHPADGLTGDLARILRWFDWKIIELLNIGDCNHDYYQPS